MTPLHTVPPALTGVPVAARPGLAADVRADDDAREWVGYESVHPLTWVPPPAVDV